MNEPGPNVLTGRIAEPAASEFPALKLRYRVLDASTHRSPKYLRKQLKHISNRMVGERAINLRREPIAHAYRVFFRHIGLDPDETPTPVESVLAERLRAGRFASAGILVDALTIAIVESGVALRAFDTQAIEGELWIRVASQGERLGDGRGEPELPDGAIVIADQHKAIAPIFGDPADRALPSRSTSRVALCAIEVAGVPQIASEEALWKCATLIEQTLE